MLRSMMKTACASAAVVGLLTLNACGGGGSSVTVPETNKTGSYDVTSATNDGNGSVTVTFPSQSGASKYKVFLGQSENISTSEAFETTRDFAADGTATFFTAAADSGASDTTPTTDPTVEPTVDPATAVTLSISDLAPGVVYYLVVQALDADGKQLFSSNVGAALQEVSISSVTYDETQGGYMVEWTKIGGVLEGYKVQWTTTSGAYTDADTSAVTAAGGTTITGLDKDTEYFFRVIAVAKNNAGTKEGVERSSAGGSCGSSHTWTGKTAIFSYASCDAVDGVTVWNNTANEAGETLGTRSPAYGKLSFTITGTTNWEIGSGDAMLIFFNAMNNGREVNWHFQYYNLGAVVEHRLTTQRFDGTCSPFCEQKSISQALQFPNSSTDRSTSYHFDCMWLSGTDPITYASCDVSDPTTGTVIYQTGNVDTQGNYGELSYVGVGNGGYHNAGPYGWPAGGKVSDFQLTFFQ